MIERLGPWITGILFAGLTAATGVANYQGAGPAHSRDLGHYVQEFGALGIVAFVVFWMMKRIDTLIKVLQAANETAKLLEANIATQNASVVETQREILTELRKFRKGLDGHNTNR